MGKTREEKDDKEDKRQDKYHSITNHPLIIPKKAKQHQQTRQYLCGACAAPTGAVP